MPWRTPFASWTTDSSPRAPRTFLRSNARLRESEKKKGPPPARRRLRRSSGDVVEAISFRFHGPQPRTDCIRRNISPLARRVSYPKRWRPARTPNVRPICNIVPNLCIAPASYRIQPALFQPARGDGLQPFVHHKELIIFSPMGLRHGGEFSVF